MGGTECLLLSSCCFLRRWPKWSNGVLEITMGMELMPFAKLVDFGLTIETRILASVEMLEEADLGINNFLMRNHTCFLVLK